MMCLNFKLGISPNPIEELKLTCDIGRDLNSVIMDYLISEGYPSAAQKFASEANIQLKVDFGSIRERVEIRDAIYTGDIQSAIEKINELNPEVLDEDPALHFSLLRLQLVELIRSCISVPDADITPALNFATTCLAPRAPSNPEFLADLERTMALLIFPPDNLAPPLAALLEPGLRKDVAKKVNEALLRSQGEATKAKICDLVRLRAWSEQKAREAKKDLPAKIHIGLDTVSSSNDKAQEGEADKNGESDAMVT